MPEFFQQGEAPKIPSGDFTTSKSNRGIAPMIDYKSMSDAGNGNIVDKLLRDIALSPDSKAQRYNTPVIKTPVKNAPQYLYNAEEVGYNALDPNLEQKYEATQSIWDSIKNRTVKTGLNAFIGLYSGFASTLDFISGKGTQGIAANEGLEILNKASEDIGSRLPNFKSQYDIDNPYFNTHLAGSIFESLGFTGGAIASSLLLDAAIAPLTEGIGSAILLPRQVQMITSKWSKLSDAMIDGGKNYKTLLKSLEESGELTDGVQKALKNYDRFSKISNATRFGLNVSVSALGESAIEANQTTRTIRKNLMDNYVDEYGNYIGGAELLSKIEKTAIDGGANTVLPNFMFLALSNSIGLGSVLRPSRAAVKATQEALGSRIGLSVENANVIKAATKPYSKGILGLFERAKSPTAIIKDNLREAFEEGYQFVVSDANTNYYQRKFNAKSNNELNSMQEEYYNSIGKAFTTEEGIQSMIMGFGGGMIQNGVKRVANRVRGIKSGAELAAQIQDNMNKFTTTSIFNNPRQEAATANMIMKEMENAAATGDILGYKNLQLEALFNWVNSGVKNHRFEARLEQLEKLKGLDAESFQTMWGVDLNESSKKTVDTYIDAVANKAKSIKDNIEKIDNAFGKNTFNKNDNPLKYASFENYKQELAISLSQLDDYKRRVNDIKNNISSKLPAMNLDEVVELSSVEGISNTIDRFNTRIAELKNSEELAKGNKDLVNTFKEEREFLERRVKEMAWAKEDNKNYTQDFLGTINSIHNYYGNGKSVRGNFSINELDSYNILANSKDVDLLLKEVQRVSQYYRELTGEEGYDNFERKYTKDVTDYMDNIVIDANGKVRVKEPEVPKTIDEKLKENDEQVQEALKEFSVGSLEEIDEEIKKGNVKVTRGGLKRRDPNDPLADEREKAEAEALLEVLKFPQFEELETGTIRPRENMRPLNPDGTIREKAAQLEDEEDTSKPKETSTTEEISPDDTSEELVAPVDKLWKKAVFKFYNFFNKINSWKNKDEDTLGELLKVLSSNSKEDIVNNITFKLEDAPKSSRKPSKVPLFVKQPDGSYKKKTTDLLTGPYTYNVEVWFKNKKVGILQEPSRLVFANADGSFTPLGDITNSIDYQELTLNDPSTYEAFRQQYDEYAKVYKKIVDQKGKKKAFTNKEVLDMFNVAINYGRIATTKNQEFATTVADLKLWKGSGIIQLNKEGELIILNEEELSPEELKELIAFIGNESTKKQLTKSGRDYFVISKLPDGRFTDKLSIVFARATDVKADLAKLEKAFKDESELSDVTVSIASKEHGTSKLSFVKNADGSVVMVLKNNKRSVTQLFNLPFSELSAAENIEDIVDIINNALTKINNPLLRKLNMQIRSNDFMLAGINDKTSLSDIKSNLKAAVSTPDIYSGFSLNFYPKSLGIPATTTPAATTTTTPTATPVATTATSAAKPIVLDIVPEAEYMEFVDKNTVSEDRLNSIADKVMNKTALSPYETAMFAGKTAEINQIIIEKARASTPIADLIVNDNLNSIILQLESKGFLTKNCD